jgi:hypothetical protein
MFIFLDGVSWGSVARKLLIQIVDRKRRTFDERHP